MENLKKLIKLFIKWIGLSLVMFVSWIIGITIASAILGINNTTDPENQSILMGMMLVTASINTAVVMFPVVRSKWHDMKLIGVVFLLIFGIQFFIGTGMETLFFNESVRMPMDKIVMMNLGGFILAGVFSPVVVWVMGKMKGSTEKVRRKVVLPTNTLPMRFGGRIFLRPPVPILSGVP